VTSLKVRRVTLQIDSPGLQTILGDPVPRAKKPLLESFAKCGAALEPSSVQNRYIDDCLSFWLRLAATLEAYRKLRAT
jgi:hypothetical protein